MPFVGRVSIALISVALSLPTTAQAAPFPNGVSGLFAGHSFFAPVADDFSAIALANGYDGHSAEVVISGSQSGSPRRLWENPTKRAEIIGHLDDRDIDLFGLTVFSEEDSRFEDYERWFNEALKHNPDTEFFIGHPQTPEGAVTPSPLYEAITEELGEQTFQIVKQLRAAYPNNPVHFIHYGKVATGMKYRFDAGELPDIRGLLTDEELMIGRDEAMFTDVSPGHGGTMLKELGALAWMKLLYGADIDTLDYTDYESDVSGIIAEVAAFNEPFRYSPLGDYNLDGVVDSADYTLWRDAQGTEGLGLVADGDGDGVVDRGDYGLWLANYGSPAPKTSAIPEPASGVVGSMMIIAVGARRRGVTRR